MRRRGKNCRQPVVNSQQKGRKTSFGRLGNKGAQHVGGGKVKAHRGGASLCQRVLGSKGSHYYWIPKAWESERGGGSRGIFGGAVTLGKLEKAVEQGGVGGKKW